jgi:hypothetical protein
MPQVAGWADMRVDSMDAPEVGAKAVLTDCAKAASMAPMMVAKREP